MRNAEWGMRNAEWGMRNGECGMRNVEWPVLQKPSPGGEGGPPLAAGRMRSSPHVTPRASVPIDVARATRTSSVFGKTIQAFFAESPRGLPARSHCNAQRASSEAFMQSTGLFSGRSNPSPEGKGFGNLAIPVPCSLFPVPYSPNSSSIRFPTSGWVRYASLMI